ncbi:chromosomal replication initiator protein DnaA [Endomicrobium proavitum]|uniref:Chromosomal replication initiator protein DnaA n=1 Tax=Endomicrobium proavitum TaxID=1408281 RepID=A0A0G3WKW1_9BACT|nr:chromosomal replication initiator protein DnaA [Endomicrobium proavitum]AKL98487.1 chromosomal replication initiator protein DnaA, DNA-binding transcriptional dual regulator [Endomicrobium proavitum]
MIIESSELWQKVVDNLNLSINPETYNLWIAPLKPISFENNIFTVAVPNVYFSQWIEAHQQKNIEQLLSAAAGAQIVLQLQPQQDIMPVIAKVENTPAPADVAAPISQRDQINPKYVFERFVVGSSNRFAHGCSEAVAKNPGKQFNPLFIYGGVGLGKTHLLHAIGNYIKQNNPALKVLYVTAERFTSEFIEALRFDKMPSFKNKYRNLDCLLIDDIQFLVGKGSSQEEFFYMFNSLHTSGKQIVVSSDRPPKELEKVEERLISRFEWGITADIASPDLETRIAILRKKAEDEKLYVPDDVIIYIATQIKSNIRELEGSLLRITAFSAFTGTPLTVDSVQKILKDIIKPQSDAAITIDNIQKIVAEEFNIELRDMKSKRRTDAVAFPRQIAMYLARTLSDKFSTTDIGDAFGGRDHTTVMHACNKIKEKMNSDPYFNAKLNQIIKKIRAAE